MGAGRDPAIDAGDNTIAPDVVDEILRRSEGVPLHLEEFALPTLIGELLAEVDLENRGGGIFPGSYVTVKLAAKQRSSS